MSDEGLKGMSSAAIATVTLAAVSLTGIAVLTGFKDSGSVDNTTADKFISGLAVFGTFMTVITLALVGKIVIGIFKKGY